MIIPLPYGFLGEVTSVALELLPDAFDFRPPTSLICPRHASIRGAAGVFETASASQGGGRPASTFGRLAIDRPVIGSIDEAQSAAWLAKVYLVRARAGKNDRVRSRIGVARFLGAYHQDSLHRRSMALRAPCIRYHVALP